MKTRPVIIAILVTACLVASCGKPPSPRPTLQDRLIGMWDVDFGSSTTVLFELRDGMMVAEPGTVFADYEVVDHETVRVLRSRQGRTMDRLFKVEFLGATMFWTTGLSEDSRTVWTFRPHS